MVVEVAYKKLKRKKEGYKTIHHFVPPRTLPKSESLYSTVPVCTTTEVVFNNFHGRISRHLFIVVPPTNFQDKSNKQADYGGAANTAAVVANCEL